MTNGVVPRCRQSIVINHFIIIFIERYKNQQIHHPRCRQRSVHWLLNLVSRYCCSSSSFLWRVVFDNLDIDVVKNDILAYRAFSLLNVPCLRCHVNTSKKRKSLPHFGLIQNFKKKRPCQCEGCRSILNTEFATQIYHPVNRLRSFLLLGHLVTRSLGHSVTIFNIDTN